MKIELKNPIALNVAAKKFRIGYLVLRRGALRGQVAAQLIGHSWLVERDDAKRYAAERRPFRRARKS